MIVQAPATARKEETNSHGRWNTLLYDSADSGGCEAFKEGRLPPNSSSKITRDAGEILTYVHEGLLSYQDSNGISESSGPREFYRTTLAPQSYCQETNSSGARWVHLFQLWLTPQRVSSIEHERIRIPSADLRSGLCLVASPDGRKNSLTVHQNAFVYCSILAKGRHLVLPLSADRTAYLHVVEGGVRLNDFVLQAGDAAILTNERAVSFCAMEQSEVLLLDAGPSRRGLSVPDGPIAC